MKITLVRSMARSAVFELVNSGCYRAPAPYTVSLDGATVCVMSRAIASSSVYFRTKRYTGSK